MGEKLEILLLEVISHLGAAQRQRTDSDDKIIACRIDEARAIASSALAAARTPDVVKEQLIGALRQIDTAITHGITESPGEHTVTLSNDTTLTGQAADDFYNVLVALRNIARAALSAAAAREGE